MIYRPSACPGGLAPHLWLEDESSLYDHFGDGISLLLTADAAFGEVDRATSAAANLGVPLKVVKPRDTRLLPRYGARFALIRPDQHVAWRGDALPQDMEGLLKTIAGRSKL